MSLLSSLRYEMKSDFVLDDEDIDGPTIEDSSGFFVGCAGLICDIGRSGLGGGSPSSVRLFHTEPVRSTTGGSGAEGGSSSSLRLLHKLGFFSHQLRYYNDRKLLPADLSF